MKRFIVFVLTVCMLAVSLCGCSLQKQKTPDESGTNANEPNGNSGVDPEGNGGGASSRDDSVEGTSFKNTGGIFFRPEAAGTGDVTPYYYDGQYYLFFLHSTVMLLCFATLVAQAQS